MSKPLQPLHEALNLWCQWCVEHERFVPFEEWKNYTLPAHPHGFAIMEYESVAPKKPGSEAWSILDLNKDTLEEVCSLLRDGRKKIKAIVLIRNTLGCGLREAKRICETIIV